MRAWKAGLLQPPWPLRGLPFPREKGMTPGWLPSGGGGGGGMCLLPPQSPGPGSWWDGEEAAHLSLPGAQHKARLINCGDS